MDYKEVLKKVFAKENPLGKFFKIVITVVVGAVLLKIVLFFLTALNEKPEKEPKINDVINFEYSISQKALLQHLHETKQIDTVYINDIRLSQIEDSLKYYN